MNQKILEKFLCDLPLGGIKYYESTDSTNDQALELFQEGSPDPFLVIANEQTKGRGRAGKTWFTPPDSALAFSLIIAPNKPTKQNHISRLTGLGAVAVCEGLNELFNLHGKIKWPNDVLLDGKKVCGVLTEGHWLGEEIQTVILGIGINVAPESIPDEDNVDYPATCIEYHLEKSVDRLQLLKEVLRQVFRWKDHLWRHEFISTWQKHLAFLGERVVISYEETNNRNVTLQNGEIMGLDGDGRLILQNQHGKEFLSLAGEIHLRPLIDK